MQIIASAAQLQNAVDQNADVGTILSLTSRFHDIVCVQARAQESWLEQKKEVQQWAYFLGGLAAVVVDISVEGISAGISTASISIGGVILTKGLEDLTGK